MMDGVKVPQPGNAVKRAVDPILDQVGEEHDFEELQHKRLAADGAANADPIGVSQDRQRRRQRHVGKRLDEQAADEEVQQVLAPLVAEDMLIAHAEHAFDRNEDDAGE
jgi:hypothetical protein